MPIWVRCPISNATNILPQNIFVLECVSKQLFVAFKDSISCYSPTISILNHQFSYRHIGTGIICRRSKCLLSIFVAGIGLQFYWTSTFYRLYNESNSQKSKHRTPYLKIVIQLHLWIWWQRPNDYYHYCFQISRLYLQFVYALLQLQWKFSYFFFNFVSSLVLFFFFLHFLLNGIIRQVDRFNALIAPSF